MLMTLFLSLLYLGLLLILDEGYLLTAALPDLHHGIAPLGPPAPVQPPLLRGGVAPLGHRPWPRTWGSSSWLFLHRGSLALSAASPDLWHGVTLLGHLLSGMGSSQLLPLGRGVAARAEWVIVKQEIIPVSLGGLETPKTAITVIQQSPQSDKGTMWLDIF